MICQVIRVPECLNHVKNSISGSLRGPSYCLLSNICFKMFSWGYIIMQFALDEWLAHFREQEVLTARLDLSTVSVLAKHLDCHQLDCPVITVAGTNGKGSTVSVLHQLYHQSGMRVASFTSPSFESVCERLRLGADIVSEETLASAIQLVNTASHDVKLRVSFFEHLTLACLLVVQQWRPDVLLLEVGMGGRLDATNIIDADCAVITNIALDHQAVLGQCREAIAKEKAGIMRRNRPVVIADPDPPQSLMDVASALSARCYLIGRDFDVCRTDEGLRVFGEALQSCDWRCTGLHPHNVAAAVQVCHIMQDKLPLNWLSVANKPLLAPPGRQEYLQKAGVHWLLDVAHNAQSVDYLADYIASMEIPGQKVWVIFSAHADKSIGDMLQAIHQPGYSWSVYAMSGYRAATKEQLISEFADNGITTDMMTSDVRENWLELVGNIQEGDLVVAFGSFRVVAAVKSLISHTWEA